MNNGIMSDTNAYTDVVELCALLQCLGFNIKSLDTADGNASQEGGSRTVVINCQASGLHVVLESTNLSCSCPPPSLQRTSSIWQVSGMTGGKQFSKEYGSALLGSLPKPHRERLTRELQEIVRCIKQNNESDMDKSRSGNRSVSLLEMRTPEKRNMLLKTDTPTRCRSLDALTMPKDEADNLIPTPGLLQKQTAYDHANLKNFPMCKRQSTYTLSSSTSSIRRRNKTSSPIHEHQNNVLDNLIAAEKLAEELRQHLSNTIKDYVEEGKHESSISSLALDVSKISVLKGPEVSKLQFASSPNLSGIGKHDDFVQKFKRVDSASTSNLTSKKPQKDGKLSKLRRLSPNLFKPKNSPSTVKSEKEKAQERSSRLSNLFKPKIVTPVRIPKPNQDASPNLSASRKKFSHVKSTIPRPSAKKD